MEQNQASKSSGPRRPVTSETGVNFKCPQCAGALKYDIQERKLRCEQCSSLFLVSKIQDPTALKRQEYSADMETVEYHCPSCGASLHTTSSGVTTFCSFCGSDVVLQERMTRMRRPDRIVPFTLTREKCEKLYRERLQGAMLVPGDMREEETITRFRPVYIPFWCLSGKGDGTCKGEQNRTTTSQDYITVNTYAVEMSTRVSVTGVYYDACTQFDDETAQWLAFSGKQSVPFHPAYLSGFYAEAPDVESADLSVLVRDYASRSLGLPGVGSLPENFEEKAELVLMPVWLLASRQGKKMVYTAVKGTDNDLKVRCELPVSPKRFTLMFLIFAALLTALILGLRHYIILRPQITAALACVLAMFCWNAAGPFLARMHLRGKDSDPTRSMLRNTRPGDKRNLLRYLPSSVTDKKENPRYTIRWKYLLLPCAVLCVILFLGVVFNRNPLRALNSLISDNSALAPILCVCSAVLLIIIWFRNQDLSSPDRYCLFAQIVICVLSALFTQNKSALYIMGLVSAVITLLVLLNAFRLHNVYVTRPVPFFDEKEGDR